MKTRTKLLILAAAAVGANTRPMHADLIAYWPLDDGDGTVATDTVGGFDGTIVGGNWISPGRLGEFAYEATGADEINCGPEAVPATEDLTLAWWMIDNHLSFGTIFDKSITDSGFGYNILVRPSNEDSPLRFRIGGWQSYGGWGEECRVPVGAYNDGEWVHVVCTYDSVTDTASIYINGELPENGAFNPKTGIAGPAGYCEGVNNVDTPLFIRGGEETFNGVLDEVAIWDHALTAEEVMAVFTDGVLASESTDAFIITDIDVVDQGATLDTTLTFKSDPNGVYITWFSVDGMNTWLELDDGVASEGETTQFQQLNIPRTETTRHYRVSE